MIIPEILENEHVILKLLKESDFADLYAVASDPKIWEQHPNKDRWKQEVFRVFFDGALQSKGAYKIVYKATGEVMGSTRIYDYNSGEGSILVGYTFYSTKWWGRGVNHQVKKLMLSHLFRFVSKVYFHIGAANIRSQIAIERLGATKVGEQQVAYFGESPRMNFVYVIEKSS